MTDRCALDLTEGEWIVLRLLVRGEPVPVKQNRALNSLRSKVERANLRRQRPSTQEPSSC